MILKTDDLLDLKQTDYAVLFDEIEDIWEAIPKIKPFVADSVKGDKKGIIHPTAVVDDNVDIGTGTVVGPHAVIQGPTIIGENCQIRVGAYIRGNVLIGDNVVIGNSTEIKNALLFNNVCVPHFNYVGDSILGHKVHLGGGAVISNYKSDGSDIKTIIDKETYNTGLRKFGAILGDNAEIGSSALLNPGTIIGRNSVVYAGAVVRGYIPSNHILKVRQEQELVQKNKPA
ncbi:MAG: DapH/DapD/GlmU-related protein [bacterium]|nr:DapH/DapD/GlmU-related protein [bacterium]